MTAPRFDAVIVRDLSIDCPACEEVWGRWILRPDAVAARREHNATPEHRANRKAANREGRTLP